MRAKQRGKRRDSNRRDPQGELEKFTYTQTVSEFIYTQTVLEFIYTQTVSSTPRTHKHGEASPEERENSSSESHRGLIMFRKL